MREEHLKHEVLLESKIILGIRLQFLKSLGTLY